MKLLKRIKQFRCEHKFTMPIDLDELVTNEEVLLVCELCQYAVEVELIAFTMGYAHNVHTHTNCRKKAYPSSKKAKRAMKTIKRTSSRSVIPNRTYHCPDCKKYHLTSKSWRK